MWSRLRSRGTPAGFRKSLVLGLAQPGYCEFPADLTGLRLNVGGALAWHVEGQKLPGSLTRSRTLDFIRASGTISRVELAKLSGLTPASISGIVARTIADGLVVESGFSASTGGKPRTLLRLNPSARHAVGVTLDQNRLTYMVTDLSGHLVGRLVTDGNDDDTPQSVVRHIADQLTELLKIIAVDRASVVGIGVASPGPLDRTGRLLCRKPTPAWCGFSLGEELEEHSQLPVMVDNDATCAGVGQYWVSNGNPAAVSATVYMADGIGCGILLDGIAFHGSSANPGELGHVSLDLNGPACVCGSRGCLEVYATPAVVVAQAFRDPGLVADLDLDARDGARRNFSRIGRAASRGHPASLDLISGSAAYVASAIVSLSNILDLDEVHLCGPGFVAAGAIYGRIVQDRLRQASFARNVHSVQVHVSRTGTDAAALGAAALVLQHAITPSGALR